MNYEVREECTVYKRERQNMMLQHLQLIKGPVIKYGGGGGWVGYEKLGVGQYSLTC